VLCVNVEQTRNLKKTTASLLTKLLVPDDCSYVAPKRVGLINFKLINRVYQSW
jgi:hypothetical protein